MATNNKVLPIHDMDSIQTQDNHAQGNIEDTKDLLPKKGSS